MERTPTLRDSALSPSAWPALLVNIAHILDRYFLVLFLTTFDSIPFNQFFLTRLHPLATVPPGIFASAVQALRLPLEAQADHRVRRARFVWLAPFHPNCVRPAPWLRRRPETLSILRACHALPACIAVCTVLHRPPHCARADMFALVVPIPLCLRAVPVMLVHLVPTV
jgi:hypothetical protein